MEYNPSTDGLFFAETFQGQDPFTSVRACVRAADTPPPCGPPHHTRTRCHRAVL